jgi:hypothetical protein
MLHSTHSEAAGATLSAETDPSGTVTVKTEKVGRKALTDPDVTDYLSNYGPDEVTTTPLSAEPGACAVDTTPCPCRAGKPKRACPGWGFHKAAVSIATDPLTPGGTDLHYPKDSTITTREREICNGCHKRDDCTRYALGVDVTGMWGGTTMMERIVWRRANGVTAILVNVPDYLSLRDSAKWPAPAERTGIAQRVVRIATAHHGSGWTCAEAAADLGVTKQRVESSFKTCGIPNPWGVT